MGENPQIYMKICRSLQWKFGVTFTVVNWMAVCQKSSLPGQISFKSKMFVGSVNPMVPKKLIGGQLVLFELSEQLTNNR